MPIKTEIQIMTEAIIKQHNGQAYFNIEEGAKIIDCGRNTFARMLSDSGVTVKKVGTSKRVSAHDIAMLMGRGRVASYENGARI
jgi:hypothetical protein